jgi:hypothetical protein
MVCRPARKSERIRSTMSTLFGGWQCCTSQPRIARVREKTRSGPSLKKTTRSSAST